MMEKERVVGGPWHRDRGTGQSICTACMGFTLCRHGGSSARGVTSSSIFTGIIRSPFFWCSPGLGDEHPPWLTLLTTMLVGPVSVEVRVSVRAWIRAGPGTGPTLPNTFENQLNSTRGEGELGAVIDQGFGGGGVGGAWSIRHVCRGFSGACPVQPQLQFAPIFPSLRSDSVVSSSSGVVSFSPLAILLSSAPRREWAHLPAPLFDFFFLTRWFLVSGCFRRVL
jgi:hypothetical protein